MNLENKSDPSEMKKQPPVLNISEDWWAVILAFLVILLSVIGILGKNGIPISF